MVARRRNVMTERPLIPNCSLMVPLHSISRAILYPALRWPTCLLAPQLPPLHHLRQPLQPLPCSLTLRLELAEKTMAVHTAPALLLLHCQYRMASFRPMDRSLPTRRRPLRPPMLLLRQQRQTQERRGIRMRFLMLVT